MRAYQGREKFNDQCNEGVSFAFVLYETLDRVCRLTEHEKAEAFPFMLKEEALSYNRRVYSTEDTFDGLRQKLFDFYTREK